MMEIQHPPSPVEKALAVFNNLETQKAKMRFAILSKNREQLNDIYQFLEEYITRHHHNVIMLDPSLNITTRIKMALAHSWDLFLDSNDIAFNLIPIMSYFSLTGVVTPVIAFSVVLIFVAVACLPSLVLKYKRGLSKEALEYRIRRYITDIQELTLNTIFDETPPNSLPEKQNDKMTHKRHFMATSAFKHGFKDCCLVVGLATLLPSSILGMLGYTALAATISSGVGLSMLLGVSAVIGVGIGLYVAFNYRKNSLKKIERDTALFFKERAIGERISRVQAVAQIDDKTCSIAVPTNV